MTGDWHERIVSLMKNGYTVCFTLNKRGEALVVVTKQDLSYLLYHLESSSSISSEDAFKQAEKSALQDIEKRRRYIEQERTTADTSP